MLRRSRSFALKERLFYSASLLSVIQLELSADIQYSLINTRALPMPTTGKSLTYQKRRALRLSLFFIQMSVLEICDLA